MLFLGAGASKPFGIPTMSEFTQEIPKSLQDDEAKEFNRILARLGEFGFQNADIESVMDVLSAREDLKRAKKSIGPRLIEFVEKELKSQSDFKAGVFLDKIKDQIEARCSKAHFTQANAYYDKLFQKVPSSYPSGLFRQIFTTNYDRCLEEFLENRSYEDGFEQSKGFGRVFTGNWPEAGNAYVNTLCKLHGSVDWFQVGDRVYQFPFVPGQSLTNKQMAGRMMVYPASEKYTMVSPYAESLFYLRRSLMTDNIEPFVIVVGYSFRDDPINNAFIDALKVNRHLRILSVRPLASANQYELEEPLRSKVVPVDAEFGKDTAFGAIRSAIQKAG